ncbi:IS3 family transposase [Vibrio sp.]|uniref:IS3 family transposase n=1 Tax=Vibrio sp. TaxID=678 RepID=UPI003D100131
MVDRAHDLPVTRQCQLLSLNRSTVYYQPKVDVSDEDLQLMRRIDEMHLKRPYYGSRRIRDWLNEEGHNINRKRVQRLMRLMGIVALYPKKNTSKPGKGHKIYPYLLKGLTMDRPGQVYCSDITYIPMSKGFVYLTVVMDWYSRKVLSWRLSNTLESDFCVDVLEVSVFTTMEPFRFHLNGASEISL